METAKTQTVARQFNFDAFTTADATCDDKLVEKRLNKLLEINAENERKKAMFRTKGEELEAELMSNPYSIKKTFSFFGLLLGTFAPAAMFTRFIIDARIFQSNDFWILGVMFVINLLSASGGYFSGKLIGRIVSEAEKISWTRMILILPFIGILWGVLAGGAGGVIVFIFGAFFGAALGAAVGGVALPAFTIFHRLLKRGDEIEQKHFLPLAYGVTFIISAFILGL
ncbi:MAG: hypothetical protein M3033_15095 [Acidobacteriota bacterium]|nr:hypothetical protein [Acidobacteriota bacterium]